MTGPGAGLHDVAVHPEVRELPLERGGVGLQLLARAGQRGGGRRLEEPHRGELEGLRAARSRSRTSPARPGPSRPSPDFGLGRLLHDQRRGRKGLLGFLERRWPNRLSSVGQLPIRRLPRRDEAACAESGADEAGHAAERGLGDEERGHRQDREQDDPRAHAAHRGARAPRRPPSRARRPCGRGCSASVSERRARMPVTLMRSRTRPASPGQPRASGARTKAHAP